MLNKENIKSIVHSLFLNDYYNSYFSQFHFSWVKTAYQIDIIKIVQASFNNLCY